MSDRSAAIAPPPAGLRLGCAGAALATTGLLVASLLGLFHHHSRTPWLKATPQLLAETDACRQLPHANARERCTQRVIAAYREHQAREVLLAQVR